MATGSLGDDRFKRLDAASYDTVTGSYDRFTEAFTTPLAEKAVALADIRPADRVLDVATGTGVVARAVARLRHPGGGIVGADLSAGMLAKAREKAASSGLAIEFVESDAEALAFPTASFDVVLSLFGLMHFPHPEAAVAEMFRVLKPGGRVVIGVGSSPAPGTGAHFRYALDRALEMVERGRGRWLAAPSYIDGLAKRHLSMDGEPETSGIARSRTHPGFFLPRIVRGAGFENLRRTWNGYAPRFNTPEEFWEMQATYSSFARKRLQRATSAQVTALRAEFMATCRSVLACGGSLVYRYGALFVSAQRTR